MLYPARAAARNPEPILRHVEKEDAEARDEALRGRYFEWRGQLPHHVSAEDCQESDAEHGMPFRAALRAWCGTPEVERWDEARALRHELARLSSLVDKAVEALRRAGVTRAANTIERERSRSAEAKGSR
jgi:uncharacterized protein YjiS (DUF1127 family)